MAAEIQPLFLPDQAKLEKYLRAHASLNNNTFKDVLETVAKVAAERFANQPLPSTALAVRFLIFDLKKGEDGFTHDPLPQIELTSAKTMQLQVALRKALIDCAKITPQDPVDDSKSAK